MIWHVSQYRRQLPILQAPIASAGCQLPINQPGQHFFVSLSSDAFGTAAAKSVSVPVRNRPRSNFKRMKYPTEPAKSRFLTRFRSQIPGERSKKEFARVRGQHWMWVARVLKRSNDKRKLIRHSPDRE